MFSAHFGTHTRQIYKFHKWAVSVCSFEYCQLRKGFQLPTPPTPQALTTSLSQNETLTEEKPKQLWRLTVKTAQTALKSPSKQPKNIDVF